MLNSNKIKITESFLPYKTEVATIFTDVTDFDNEQKCTSSYYQMCISKRQKSDIIIIIILWGKTNRFLDLKQHHSLEHAETKKYIFLFSYLFCLENFGAKICLERLLDNLKEIKIQHLSW